MAEHLTAERVTQMMKDVLFTSDEVANGEPQNAVKVEGIVRNFGFNPTRLEAAKPAIAAMLGELPEEFRADKGGGWTFLNACNTRDGEQWTGMQSTMEELFALGMGVGLVTCVLPRDLWPALPGGVPYYAVNAAA